MVCDIFCVADLDRRSAVGDWDLGLHQNVEACDWTVRSERAGERLEFGIDKRARQKKRYESSVCFV